MKCAICGGEIHGAYVVIRIDGKYVPVHRDCGMCVSYHGPQPKKKPRCRVTRALKQYREEHDDD
ncbi:MAG: hypothetical protein LKG17_07565 [Megasphaera sp.]|jgi:ribosome-binding protein aMBF1 (putative translation factor)|nr:hypothetical protein [Megasphaera sp.]